MELWDLYDFNRQLTGKTMRRGDPVPEGLYRLVVHICIFNSKGEMLIQKRQPFKSGWSGMWDVSVGGSAVAGDTSARAAERELFEELGLKHSFEGVRPTFTYNFDKGFDDVYVFTEDVDTSTLTLQYEEVEKVKWADAKEIKRMIDADEFIPYDKSYIDFLFYRRNNVEMTVRGDTTSPKL